MKRLLFLLGLAGALRAANAPDPAVMLPPMLVEESASGATWFYVNTGDTEVLSRCSYGVTREIVEAWEEQLRLVHALVPAELLPRRDVPSVLVLYAQDLDQTVSAEIKKEVQSREKKAAERSFNIAPGMRLADRDTHATISYVDESRFDGGGLKIASSHVRYLLQARVPELPGWLLDGIERLLRDADLQEKPITLPPMSWLNLTETNGLVWEAARPRAVLPAAELFAGDTWPAAERRHPEHVAVRAGTEELFARWALGSGGATRAAFWRLAARAAEKPVTEETFEALFGFDYAELRDRLSDYLPRAVAAAKWIDPGDLPKLPRVEVERATPNQIARVRGEWERLAIGHVQLHLPTAREPYIAQARRTLHRAYDAGDRDPRLLATMGLCEIDAGNPAGALAYLEPAVAARVVRPRAYFELARLRFADLRRDAPATKTFSIVELTPVLDPLQRSLTQAPPLPETFALLAEAWLRCDAAPSPAEWGELAQGPRLFPRRAEVALPVARILARHGRKGEAVAALDDCAAYTFEPSTRAEVARLRAELAR